MRCPHPLLKCTWRLVPFLRSACRGANNFLGRSRQRLEATRCALFCKTFKLDGEKNAKLVCLARALVGRKIHQYLDGTRAGKASGGRS